MPYNCPMVWSRADILRKVEDRAAHLGRSMKEVLPPGYDTFFAPSKSEGSPTIATLERLAEGLEWSLCELLCEPPPAVVGLDYGLMQTATETALRAIPSDRSELLPAAIVSAYDVLADRRRNGLPLDESALSTLEATLRAQSRGR